MARDSRLVQGRSPVTATGAEMVVEVLRDLGVGHVFGVGGTTINLVLDPLARAGQPQFVTTVHELAAVAMADGYARARGGIGVALVHNMPGVANMMGALYNAYRDWSPLVILGGCQDLRITGRGAFTEADDIVEPTKQITKWAFLVPRTERIPEAILRAAKVALAPPPGPVFLAIPTDVMRETATVPRWPRGGRGFRVSPHLAPDARDIAAAARLLLTARKPLVIAGGRVGLFGATDLLVRLCERLALPVLLETVHTAELGFPAQHPLSFGRFTPSSPVLRHADLILAIGGRLFMEDSPPSEPWLPPGVPVIQIDVDPWEIAKIYPVALGIVADPRSALTALSAAIAQRTRGRMPAHVGARRAVLARERRARAKALADDLRRVRDVTPISPRRLAHAVGALLKPGVHLVDESITTTSYLYEHAPLAPGHYHSDQGGYLGWGLGAALGFQLGRPHERVVATIGDGSFYFGLQALWTQARYAIPAVIVVCNNHAYMANKRFIYALKGYSAETGEYLGTDLALPDADVVDVARGFGLSAEKVEKPAALDRALKAALAARKPYVLDVTMDPKATGVGWPRLP